MATFESNSGISGFLPTDFGNALLGILEPQSVALDPRVALQIRTTSQTYYQPVVLEDQAASWTLEGQEIAPDDQVYDTLVLVPRALKALTIMSNEARQDGPALMAAVQAGLVRSSRAKLDSALVGNTVTNGPSGLGSIVSPLTGNYANGGPTDLGWAVDAIGKLEATGGNVSAFLTDAATKTKLMDLRTGASSNLPLLGYDALNPLIPVAYGRPIFAVPTNTVGTIWAVDNNRVLTVVRKDVEVTSSNDAFYSSDQLAFRSVLRACFGFLPNAVVKVTEAAE